MIRQILLSATLTGAFCAGFALVIDVLTEMLAQNRVLLLSFVSGFLGSLFASLVLRGRSGGAS
ncbi:MAG: hypothetical protein OIF48_09215 [Silicimonas sp.]|nr:hypothetical protein [Silicimonas sp.]